MEFHPNLMIRVRQIRFPFLKCKQLQCSSLPLPGLNTFHESASCQNLRFRKPEMFVSYQPSSIHHLFSSTPSIPSIFCVAKWFDDWRLWMTRAIHGDLFEVSKFNVSPLSPLDPIMASPSREGPLLTPTPTALLGPPPTRSLKAYSGLGECHWMTGSLMGLIWLTICVYICLTLFSYQHRDLD